jgi:hypothetical protein
MVGGSAQVEAHSRMSGIMLIKSINIIEFIYFVD